MKVPRNTKTENAYTQFKEGLADNKELLESFNFDDETIIREFTYWVIIKNRFPYDRMARTNDMLVSRRPLISHYHGTEKEKEEYGDIMQLLAKEEYYDALIENFPKVKSVKKFAHTHLVQWHNTAQ